MASFYRVVFSGSSDTISVPFPYLDKNFVEVRLDGILLSSSDYTWPSNGQVKITAGNPTAGVVGEVRRNTPTTPLVSFQPGNLDPSDLDSASVQAIHLAEEAKDNTTDIVDRAWYTADFQTGGLITKGGAGAVPMFDASGNLVVGPTATQVAAAQGYAEAAEASAAAAATFDPANFYTKAVLDVVFGAYDLELDDLTDNKADKTIAISSGGLATGGGDLSANRTITVPKASDAEHVAMSRDDVAATPKGIGLALVAYNKWKHIATVDSAGATVFAHTDLGAYRQLFVDGVMKSVSTAGYPILQFSSDNGATWITTTTYDRLYGYHASGAASGVVTSSQTGVPFMAGGTALSSSRPSSFRLNLKEFNKAVPTVHETDYLVIDGSGVYVIGEVGGHEYTSIAVNAFRFNNTQSLVAAYELMGLPG